MTESLYTPILYTPEFQRGTLAENLVDVDAAGEIIEYLGSDELSQQIACGEVTLAMVRPALDEGVNFDGDDTAAADVIEATIANLGVKAKFAVQFDDTAIEQFYGEARQAQLSKPPEREPRYSNRWEEFSAVMQAGPTTILLLYTPEGDAVNLWRSQVGHWDIVNRRDESTIRGQYGTDNYNNLVHGSDSADSVENEIAIIRSMLARQLEDQAPTQ